MTEKGQEGGSWDADTLPGFCLCCVTQACSHFKSSINDSGAQLGLRAIFYTVIQGIVVSQNVTFVSPD